MQELINYLEQSVEDNAFSRGDKRGFKELLNGHDLKKEDLDFLRSKVFDLAMLRADSDNYSHVITWLEAINKTLVPSPEKRSTDQAFFSPGEECLNAIRQQLRAAVSTVRICVFTISDDRIAQEIIAAHSRGVSVRVLTDNDKSLDKGSDIARIVRAGVAVKMDFTRNHMHHKFAVVDKEHLLTGSYNWTRSAANYNHENLLLTSGTGVVREYLKEFDRLWQVMDFYTE
jgi:phosphatidylserine/phosphatidylglycerophosphate/cardiolipin synthase-like enzyme